MEYHIAVHGTDATIQLSGRIYVQDTAVLWNVAGQAVVEGWRRVAVKLGEVTYMDCSSLRVFLSLHKQLQARSGRLTLIGVQGIALELLYQTRLHTVFTLLETEEAPAKA